MMKKLTIPLLLFAVGVVSGVLLFTVLESVPAEASGSSIEDPRNVGLPWIWLGFGFLAQAIFMSRMLVQWIATEKARSSVVPVAFWWLSLCGGLMLLTYFIRRGDPVGIVGQLFGVVVYGRNLFFIYLGGIQAAGEASG